MASKIYIDGHVGTTGLRIRDWLAGREDLELITLSDDLRKNSDARREALLSADIAVLCLPDDAAKEVASWVEGKSTRIIDASSAHRVSKGWIYGLSELDSQRRQSIADAQLVSNPGCYSSSSLLLLRPLLSSGLLAAESALFIHALSGYSGGGRGLIERWENVEGPLSGLPFEAPYAFDWAHKHIPELTQYSGLADSPQFVPAVGAFDCGMRVQIPLHKSLLPESAAEKIIDLYQQCYGNEAFVRVHELKSEQAYDELSFDPRVCNGTNRIELRVLAHPDGHVTLMAVLDNLGKGASGMAVQSLNLMLGVDEGCGLPG